MCIVTVPYSGNLHVHNLREGRGEIILTIDGQSRGGG